MHRLENNRIQKCLIMASSPLDLYAREYFNSLNSLAEKISTDISTTVAAYEDLWHTLSIKDQHQVINETIIYPEVVLKYTINKSGDTAMKESASCYGEYGDTGRSVGMLWSDEHSSPFSWKTRSQQNLHVFSEETCNDSSRSNQGSSIASSDKLMYQENDTFIDPPNIVLGGSSKLPPNSALNDSRTDSDNFIDKMKSKSVVLKIQALKGIPPKKERNVSEASNFNVRVNSTCKTPKALPTRLISKPKNPPPPPPPPKFKDSQKNTLDIKGRNTSISNEQVSLSETKQSSMQSNSLTDTFSEFCVDLSTSNKSDTLPKTGFDFLDNW